MIDFQVLEAFGTSNQRLREICTAMPDATLDVVPKGETADERKDRVRRSAQNKHDLKVKEKIKQETQSRVIEGIERSLKNWKLWAAVDLAMDTSTITGITLPLQLYAQKRINVARCAEMLANSTSGKEFIKKDANGAVTGIDLPKFVETNFNLVRSVISRRHGAQVNKFNQLWPYYKYEPRSTGLVAKCRADVLSQRLDMMVDQYGYRHHDAQVMRDGMLYGHSVDFVRSSWEVEKQYERKSFDGPASDVNDVIVKEGVQWINPLPARVFWDSSGAHGLASINTDDLNWIGFWDVCRFSEIEDNPDYFNKQAIGWTGRFWGEGGIYNTYGDFFSHYLYTITPPQGAGEINLAGENDRKAQMGIYTGNYRDASVFVTNYYRKLVPKDWGIGEYPFAVWVRFVCASDSTCIFAEIMPSTPAAYLGINENDSRQCNVSMAMELFSAQDQMTNLMTQLMFVCQIELFKIIGINTDMVSKEQLASIRERFKTGAWLEGPTVIEYSLAVMEQRGVKVDKLVEFHEAHQGATIQSIFEAMVRLVEMTEKLIAMSPNETGQPAPREITATESNEISTTTSTIYSRISEDIDEYRAAKKRICYESIIACHKGEIVCPVKDRYTDKTIRAAGFKPKSGEDEDYSSQMAASLTHRAKGGGQPIRQTVIGSKRALVHDYIFTSRDGSERPVNTQAANTLVQTMGFILNNQTLAQALGKEKLYEIANEIFRLSGAGMDLNLQLKEGEDDSLGPDEMDQLKQTVEQIGQALQQLAGQVQHSAQELQQQEQVNQEHTELLKGVGQLAGQVKDAHESIIELQGKHSDLRGEIQKRLVESINYKDAPDEIKIQMERQAGFTPSGNRHNSSVPVKAPAGK